ncbi:MAG: 30S ribosomal protein S8 [bacterium]
MVGDPIADMITRIKNASCAGKDSIVISFSKIKNEIANVLKDEGYLKSVDVIGKDKLPYLRKLELGIAYFDKAALSSENRKPRVQDVKRMSKLSRRTYITKNELAANNSRGVSVLSTTSGILTGKMAKQKGLGGELLFKIW